MHVLWVLSCLLQAVDVCVVGAVMFVTSCEVCHMSSSCRSCVTSCHMCQYLKTTGHRCEKGQKSGTQRYVYIAHFSSLTLLKQVQNI